jgi:hypothetical protein
VLTLWWLSVFGACRDFQEGSAEQESERQARLSRFSGAAAISSDAYFNRYVFLEGAAGVSHVSQVVCGNGLQGMVFRW